MVYTLGISSISDISCKRKRALYILSRKKKMFFSDVYNIYGYIGNILHFTIQQVLKNKISQIEYFFFRENLDIEESIDRVLRKALNYSYFIVNHKVKCGFLTNSDLNEIKSRISNQIESISSELPKLLIIDSINKKIKTKVIDDEFTVIYEIVDGVLLTGKIDLLCYDEVENHLEFYEIKTGKLSSRTDANRQLKLYREIYLASKIRRNDHKIRLQLWSTNPGEKEYQGKIKNLRFDKRSELDKVKKAIVEYQKIQTRENLPPKIYINENTQKICDNCIFCMNEKEILLEIKKMDLMDYFTDNRSQNQDINKEIILKNSKSYDKPQISKGNIKILNIYL